jgi:hypothetical protein
MAVADILLTPATIWYAPVDEPEPDPDVVGYGDDWGGNWVDLGYTLQPLTVSITKELFKLFVEQLTNPVRQKYTQETLVFETALAEFTGMNLKLAFDGTVTVTPAGPATVGMTELETGGDVTPATYAFGFEGEYVDDVNNSFPVRIFVFKATPVLGGQLQFAKAAAVGIPIRIEALADTDRVVGKQLMKIQKVTAAAGS